jgi:hypothetical protein
VYNASTLVSGAPVMYDINCCLLSVLVITKVIFTLSKLRVLSPTAYLHC